MRKIRFEFLHPNWQDLPPSNPVLLLPLYSKYLKARYLYIRIYFFYISFLWLGGASGRLLALWCLAVIKFKAADTFFSGSFSYFVFSFSFSYFPFFFLGVFNTPLNTHKSSFRVPRYCLLNVYANIYISEVWPNDKIFDFNTNTNGQKHEGKSDGPWTKRQEPVSAGE